MLWYDITMSHVKKNILVFSGPSGVGKSTLAHALIEAFPRFSFSVSATTREPRGAEVHGVDYYFLSPQEFRDRIEKGDFLEWEEVYTDRYYGTLRSEIDRITSEDNIAIFDIDVLGALNVKKQFPDHAHIVFIKPESIEKLTERLLSRGTESPEEVALRVERFQKELALEDKFDDCIINTTGEIDASVERIVEIARKHFI